MVVLTFWLSIYLSRLRTGKGQDGENPLVIRDRLAWIAECKRGEKVLEWEPSMSRPENSCNDCTVLVAWLPVVWWSLS